MTSMILTCRNELKGAWRVHGSHNVGCPTVDQPKVAIVRRLISKNRMRTVRNIFVTWNLKKNWNEHFFDNLLTWITFEMGFHSTIYKDLLIVANEFPIEYSLQHSHISKTQYWFETVEFLEDSIWMYNFYYTL